MDRLRIFDIDWWLDHLVPICDQFAEASQGNIDRTHWNNICKLENAYGGDVINGWVAGMFPYLREFPGGPCTRRNPIFSTGKGFQTYLAPSGLSQVPMTWRSASGQERCMEVLGGLTGVQQDPDSLALEPIAGWAVRCADQLDQLLLRLKNEHVTVPTPPRSVTSNEDQSPERSFLSDRYPPDLGRFYYQFTHAVIADEHKCHIRILPFDQITGIDWGEGPCLGSRGPDGHTWYRFAELSDGRWLAINLDCNRFQLESESWESDDTTFDPICLSSESTVGCLSANPVVAWNFQEWLQRTLDHGTTSQETAWYWDDVDFEPLDDAASLIRADKGW